MSIWFTSDTHYGHVNIIDLAARPFSSLEEMNATLIDRWNQRVRPDDPVFHLGDVAMGSIKDSLPLISQLNGVKVLVAGNHDRCWTGARKATEWRAKYHEVGFLHILEEVEMDLLGHRVRLCHFPYRGDSHDEDRYRSRRPSDDGMILLHGHTHQAEVLSGPRSLHVGVDAHDYAPVGAEELLSHLPSGAWGSSARGAVRSFDGMIPKVDS